MKAQALLFLFVMTLGLCVGSISHAQDPNYVLDIDGPAIGSLGGTVNVDFKLSSTGPISGWSWGVCESDALLHVSSVNDGPTTLTVDGGSPASFNAPSLLGGGWTIGVVINFFGNNALPAGTGHHLHTATYDLLAEGNATIDYCNVLGSPVVETVLVDTAGDSVFPTTSGLALSIVAGPPPFKFDAGSYLANFDQNTGVGSFTAHLTIEENTQNGGFPTETQGFSMGVSHDSSLLTAVNVSAMDALTTLGGGSGPDFFGPGLLTNGVTVGVVFDFVGGTSLLFDSAASVVSVQYDTVPGALAGNPNEVTTSLSWIDSLGTPQVENTVVVDGASLAVEFVNGSVTLAPLLDTPFVRGDCNADTVVNIADGIFILNTLFQGGPEGTCAEACNTNADAVLLDQSDAIFIFMYRFLGGPTPAAPFGSCGTVAGADCEAFDACL